MSMNPSSFSGQAGQWLVMKEQWTREDHTEWMASSLFKKLICFLTFWLPPIFF